MAVELRGVTKTYESLFGKPVPVLHNIDLHVPAGQIFGLLGPSGCGKTTLLRCIVSRIQPDEGAITVLGKPLGAPESGVPGRNVGYMPQELALVLELTIAETLWYFGRLVGMDTTRLKGRIDFLVNMLHLPKATRLMKDLSGGQQRRVSFAAALVHEPRLLILDEPTVGVDPLLRVSIWEHLMTLANTAGTTIIITTHYIEEAKRAHSVGLMRQGRLLVQSSPNQLLQTHQMNSLEAVFLHLCREDKQSKLSSSIEENQTVTEINNAVYEDQLLSVNNNTSESPKKLNVDIKSDIVNRLIRISALLRRNYLVIWRNPISTVMQILVPTVCMILVIIAVGNPYHGVKIGVANKDESFLGGLYLQQLNSEALAQIHHETKESAIESTRQRDAWGSVYINPNFTLATLTRYKDGIFARNETLLESHIVVNMDMTDFHVAYTIQKELLTSYNDLAVDLLKGYKLNPSIALSPITFEESIYGDGNPTYLNSVVPGMIVQITLCFAALLTSLACVSEYTDGLLDRSWVSGITRTDITISHLVVQGILMLCQVIVAMITTFGICRISCEGSLMLVLFMVFLVGLCGNSLGLVISTIAPNISGAILIQVVWFFSTTFMFGCLWPLEAMPRWLMYMAYGLPQTLAAEGVKSVMLRGWTMGYLLVWLSCFTTFLWVILNIILAGFIMHLRR